MGILFWVTIAVFCLTYAIIISEKVHRSVTALIGAGLMILLGVLNQERAIEGIDFNTLGLLVGMMVIVGIAKECGMFQYVALLSAKIAKGKPLRIFILLSLITAVFSAFLDNVTTVLLMIPVTFVITNHLRLDPKPFLFSTILLANIGGTATLIGDPPNILIGSAAGLSFNDFLIHLAPVSLAVGVVTIGLLVLMYRKKMHVTSEASATLAAFEPKEAITDKALLIKSLIVLSLVLLGFFTHSITHLEGATIALCGAALLLLLTMNDPEKHLAEVEWTTIFFFTGLFVLVAALEEIGAINLLAEYLLTLTHDNPAATMFGLLWGSAIFSSVVDNIPFVATMIPLIKSIGEISGMNIAPLWWILAMGADIGGNATLVGASANVIVSGMSEREGHKIGFIEYLKVAAPLTIVGLIVCSIYIWIRYL